MSCSKDSDVWALVITLETIKNGKQEEVETVVPYRWLSQDEKWLWWPPCFRVTNKVKCEPDETTRAKFEVLKVKVQGINL